MTTFIILTGMKDCLISLTSSPLVAIFQFVDLIKEFKLESVCLSAALKGWFSLAMESGSES